ncbi:MAG: phosphate ABC transporter permease subunit PstC, partial [Proteobacteria bacterium]|nr:phosphate ABC transporter permease subunit PstC [Pseudomonadota bacterium]
MSLTSLIFAVLVIGGIYFCLGQYWGTRQWALGSVKLHSLPRYYGFWAGLVATVPAILLLFSLSLGDDFLFKSMLNNFYPSDVVDGDVVERAIAFAKVMNAVEGVRFGVVEPWVEAAAKAWIGWQKVSDQVLTLITIGCAVIAGFFAFRQIGPTFRARNGVERIILWALIACSSIAIFTTLGIILSVLFESIRFFKLIPIQDFIFGLEWNPQFEGAERAGSGSGTATYGMLPMFAGTFLISVVAIMVAVPVGLFSAIYLAEYASLKTRSIIKPLLEILAGIPTVVYGFFAALTVAPLVRAVGASMGIEVASESALAAGLVMGIMIIPFVSSLSDDVINAVPQSLRDAAYGLGATKSEAIRQVVLPAALSGIVAAVILAVSRAIGETMIVVMAAGLAANLSFNPLDAVTTVTTQIVTILSGDQEFESAKTLSAFALALVLII